MNKLIKTQKISFQMSYTAFVPVIGFLINAEAPLEIL